MFLTVALFSPFCFIIHQGEYLGGDFITNNIKLYRAYKNVSQKEMAEAIGITQQTLSRIELTNKTNLSTAKKIAEYFGIDWWILYED